MVMQSFPCVRRLENARTGIDRSHPCVFVWPIKRISVPAVFLNMVSATMSQTSDPLLGESGKKLSLESYDQYITL